MLLAGLAKGVEVERGLGIKHDTLYRYRRRLAEGGIRAAVPGKAGPKGPSKATPDLQARAKNLRRAGLSKRAIARKLGVDERTVRRVLKGMPSPTVKPAQRTLLPAHGSVQPTTLEDEEDVPYSPDAPLAESGSSVHVEAAPESDSMPCALASPGDGGGKEAPDCVVDDDGEEAPDSGLASVAHDEDGDGEQRPPTCEGELEVSAAAQRESNAQDVSAFMPSSPHPETTEDDLDRTVERVFARFGKLDEAQVRFVSGDGLRFVGALLILPALVSTGFFQGVEQIYGQLKNGFYGLRHTIMTVAFMLVLRCRRAEQLTGVSPTALGRLLGLDRAPEVKTLRRRLREIADQGKAHEFMLWFAKYLAEADPDAIGFLYVDGHTRIYHGKREVSKAYSTRKRLALPAVTDFWINDLNGQPIFVVTGEASQSLTQQLLPIIEELRRGDVLPEDTRITFVFDRGGWSPKLFKRIVEEGHDFLTYRKGKYPRYPAADFIERTEEIDGRKVSYMLRDGVVRLKVGMEFRQVVRQEEDGHQIALVTSRRDVSDVELVFRLGERWRQENFFKYAREEFALDALDSYGVEAEDPERTVPNPQWKKLDKQIRRLRKEATEVEAQLGRAADANEESRRPTVRGFKIAHGKTRQKLAKIRQDIDKLLARRKKLPKRVSVSEAMEDEAVRLEVEHKHFMNSVKMAVCRAETSLLHALEPHYRRNGDEGRALLREAFRSSGSLRVEGDVLLVTLDPLSAPRRTRAIAALCEQLTDARVRIPGTTLRLAFTVSRETGVSDLAMGPCQEV
ncbi:MAG: hypothetical protein GF320_17090 [Armatimonadia bacterium]|nr:hypothetical protein [Armatimonadia bacterium]